MPRLVGEVIHLARQAGFGADLFRDDFKELK